MSAYRSAARFATAIAGAALVMGLSATTASATETAAPSGFFHGQAPLPVPDGFFHGQAPLPVPDGFFHGATPIGSRSTTTAGALAGIGNGCPVA